MPTSQPLPEPMPHIGPILDDRARPIRFEPHELAVVLSHYDLGVIEQIRMFPRGSPRAPKVRIRAERGEFLLKRRAPGRDDPFRVAFAQSIQLFVAGRGYPVPALIGTRDVNNSMLQLDGRIYELFRFIPGERYDGSREATASAGRALAELHRLLGDFESPYPPPTSSYHAAAGIDAKLARIPGSVAAREPGTDPKVLDRMCGVLRESYHEAAECVERRGFRHFRRGIIHGDWHPGNLLFDPRERHRVTAVLDFDSSRLEPLMSDLANAALQFSMTWADVQSPESAPAELDLERLRRLVRSYGRAFGAPLSGDEVAAIPWLMTEALVLESVIPIAATGTFGRLSGSKFLRMVEGKVNWIRPRADRIVRYLRERR